MENEVIPITVYEGLVELRTHLFHLHTDGAMGKELFTPCALIQKGLSLLLQNLAFFADFLNCMGLVMQTRKIFATLNF